MTKAQSITKEVYVAIYLRLSRDDQNGNAESMSIGHQRDMLMAYCEERGWKVYDIYVDATDIIGLKQNPTNRASL